MSADDIAKAFSQHYYTSFDSNREARSERKPRVDFWDVCAKIPATAQALAPLFKDGSVLTFEGIECCAPMTSYSEKFVCSRASSVRI